MSLPGSAAIPAPYRDRQESAYQDRFAHRRDGAEDLKPSDILTREAFLNAIVVNSAIGGSTNAPIHLAAIARHIGVELRSRIGSASATRCRCWSTCSRPANIWARIIIAPAACPPSSPS
jgi:dihydroxyacid dehydratase/phosphogluconate dehydratase